MSVLKVLRRFRQINRVKDHDYLAKEIHFVEVGPGRVKFVIVFDDDTMADGPTLDEKFFKMNVEGFDIPFVDKDGKDQKSHYAGMGESKCWEEIVEQVVVPPEAVVIVEQTIAR